MCSFCNQRYITGTHNAPHASDITDAVNTAASFTDYNPKTTEIAFFGGSFTAINRNYMLELLHTACTFVKNGTVSGIRISTRPDAVNDEILQILKEYSVTSIELGAQSLDDRVLKNNNRGHTTEDIRRASLLIKEYDFSLGLQMMTGLYGDNDELAVATANNIISLAPDTVRIYPTIVLKDTYLAVLFEDGKYKPQTLDDAVRLSARLFTMFLDAGIRVIRLGLHSIEPNTYIAGPWHPAFSELCQSLIYYNKALYSMKTPGKYTIYVHPSEISKMTGQARSNIIKLEELGFDCCVKPDVTLKRFEIIAERGEQLAT